MEASRQGFSLAYLILEEHLPVARCHATHLNQTLPDLMKSLPASHIALMGWDNRRHPSKSKVLGKEFHRLKHLCGERDPRYNLHPGLWSLEVLLKCCDEVLGKVGPQASAWQFERTTARSRSPSLQPHKEECYQVCAASMSVGESPLPGKIGAAMERFVYMRLIGLMLLVPGKNLRAQVFRRLNFDRVFCNGPYPMVFSGVMAKGRINPNFTRIVSRIPGGAQLLDRILSRSPETHVAPAIAS